MTCNIDLDTKVSKMSSQLHFLYGPKQQETRMHCFVYCEQSVLTESKTVRDAIIDLIATYYVLMRQKQLIQTTMQHTRKPHPFSIHRLTAA